MEKILDLMKSSSMGMVPVVANCNAVFPVRVSCRLLVERLDHAQAVVALNLPDNRPSTLQLNCRNFCDSWILKSLSCRFAHCFSILHGPLLRRGAEADEDVRDGQGDQLRAPGLQIGRIF